MNPLLKKIHETAIRSARRFQVAESDLIQSIQQVDAKRVFSHLGCNSLFVYCLRYLKLSESNSYLYIGVARKALEFPEIGRCIQQGSLKVTQAKRISSVITQKNKDIWIEKAKTLSQRQLEREVVSENPELQIKERIRPISAHLSELRCGVGEEEDKLIERVRDLESQRLKKPVSVREALRAMGLAYVKLYDPMEKAKRAQKRVLKSDKTESPLVSSLVTSSNVLIKPTKVRAATQRAPLSAALNHKLNLRDNRQCRHKDEQGRCSNRRWLESHHIKPVSHGGSNDLNNLITLCSIHHMFRHQNSFRPSVH